MDILIFMIISVFGLVLTFIGLKIVEFSFFGLLLYLILFGQLVTGGMTEVIGHNGTANISRTFDVGVLVFVPLFFAIVNFLFVVKYFRSGR